MSRLFTLARLIEQQTGADGTFPTAIRGLTLYRQSAPSSPTDIFYEPALCVKAQRAKRVMLGDREYRYDAANYLLVAAEVATRRGAGSGIARTPPAVQKGEGHARGAVDQQELPGSEGSRRGERVLRARHHPRSAGGERGGQEHADAHHQRHLRGRPGAAAPGRKGAAPAEHLRRPGQPHRHRAPGNPGGAAGLGGREHHAGQAGPLPPRPGHQLEGHAARGPALHGDGGPGRRSGDGRGGAVHRAKAAGPDRPTRTCPATIRWS